MSGRALVLVATLAYAIVVSEAVVRWYTRHPLALPQELRACWFGHRECVKDPGYCCEHHTVWVVPV